MHPILLGLIASAPMTEEVNKVTIQCDQHTLPEKVSKTGEKRLLPENNIFNMSAFPEVLSWLKMGKCCLWELLVFHDLTLQQVKDS